MSPPDAILQTTEPSVLLWALDLVVRVLSGNFVTSLFGAFAGATIAFLLETRREKRRDAERRFEAATRAIYALIRQWEIMTTMRSFIDRLRQTPKDKLNLRMYTSRVDVPRVDTGSLSFLLTHPDVAEVLHRVDVQDARFAVLVQVLEARNDFIARIVDKYPDLKERPPKGEETILNDLATEVVSSFDLALSSLGETYSRFRDFLSRTFPRREVLRFTPSSPAGMESMLTAGFEIRADETIENRA